MYWYLEVLRKYAVFQGRAWRKEYWIFTLVSTLISIGLLVVDNAIGLDFITLRGLYSLAVVIPGLAVSVRRLHDIGKSGWWLLIAFIPLAGAFVLLLFMVQPSDPRTNMYGASPMTQARENLAEVDFECSRCGDTNKAMTRRCATCGLNFH